MVMPMEVCAANWWDLCVAKPLAFQVAKPLAIASDFHLGSQWATWSDLRLDHTSVLRLESPSEDLSGMNWVIREGTLTGLTLL